MEATMLRVLGGLLLLLAVAAQSLAMDVVKPFKAESDRVRYAYHYELLDAVLERTIATHGPYRLQPYTEPISVARGHQEGLRGELINKLISDAGHKHLDEGMIPIPYPLDKGLLGHRVSLILKQTQPKIERVRDIAGLRTLKIGQGKNWGDVKILEYNRIPVEQATTEYEGVFDMLIRGRFDLFPRGVTEVVQELSAYGPRYPELSIDRHLLIRYPYAQFFYVSKSAPHLAARLKAGLEQMVRDGSFDALYDKHFATALTQLELGRRVVIELENPFLPSWVPFARKELWFDPRRTSRAAPARAIQRFSSPVAAAVPWQRQWYGRRCPPCCRRRSSVKASADTGLPK